jgi:hypothetical protein
MNRYKIIPEQIHGVTVYDIWDEEFDECVNSFDSLEEAKEWLEQEERNYDPTPWCSYCGARIPEECNCGPLADNE